MNAKDALEFLRKDWDHLPSPMKYCYVTGSFALAAGWLLKNERLVVEWHNLHIITTIQKIDFILFLALIFLAPVIRWLVTVSRIGWYRFRYPIAELNRRFYFVLIGDALNIVDTKHEVIRWVENIYTAYDLGYYPSAWIKAFKRNDFAGKLTIGDQRTIDLDVYRPKRGIRTRETPGT